MANRSSSNHQQTTLACSNLGTIIYRDRRREASGSEIVTFDTSGITDLASSIICRVAYGMQQQLELMRKPQFGNGSMQIRIAGKQVTEVVNDLFDALRRADTKVPAGMMNSQRRVPAGRKRR